MTALKNNKRNLSLDQKSAARMAAVQCIYQDIMDSGGSTPEQLIEQYKSRQNDNIADDTDEEENKSAPEIIPDYSYLLQLLKGWETHKLDIEQQLDDNLLEGWTRKRMSPLMVAILCCAICERVLHPSLKSAIWVDEYVTIASRFFSEQETGFTNRLLEKLAQPSQS